MYSTLSELLTWGKVTLQNAGVTDFQISAELLLATLLKFSRTQFLLNPFQKIDPQIEEEYKKLIGRRAVREPLQYLIGWVDFYNIRLRVDNRALIPRPETEILVETIINKLKGDHLKILDIGTGTGNIAIALARNITGSKVTGIDISPDALEIAKINAGLNDIDEHVSLIEGTVFDSEFIKKLGYFDAVISNPPYVDYGDKNKLEPEIVNHEPIIALFSESDPLRFFKTITGIISYILNGGGLLAFEVGQGQASDVCEFMKLDFRDIEITKDLAGIERVVTGIYAGTN